MQLGCKGLNHKPLDRLKQAVGNCPWHSLDPLQHMVEISRRSTQMSVSFGPNHQGLQVGYNYGSINTEFHLPPGKVIVAPLRADGMPR